MACGCDNIECIEVLVNLCNAGTEIAIPATQTGNWRLLLEFNRANRNFSIAVTSGDNISIPTFLLNANYVHLLKVYNTSDVLVGCYNLNTIIAQGVADYPVNPPDNDTWQWATVTANGNQVDDVLLTGDISPIIWLNQQPIEWAAQGIIQTATGLDFTAIGGAVGSLVFQYKNIPE